MPRVNEHNLKKLYYSIGEVAKMFDVNTSLIRFWEKEFPSVTPKKNKKGNRLFTAKEIMKIDRIYGLVKENGYTLDGAKKAIKNGSKVETVVAATPSSSELIDRLEYIKKRLIALKA